MSIPDPVTTGLVVASSHEVAKQLQDFIAALTGHPGETIGTMLGNIAHRRSLNAEKTVGRAHLTLLNIGVSPSPVALNVLQPILEGASLHEEPDLQELWANLLANAADPRRLHAVPPSFPLILRELEKAEAVDGFARSLRVNLEMLEVLDLKSEFSEEIL